MKRWAFYLIILLLLGGRAEIGREIGELHPVEVVRLECEDGQVYLTTDTGATGVGMTPAEAVENLKATTSGEVFLDTAEYLVYSHQSEVLLPLFAQWLRPSCVLCRVDGEGDLAKAGAFLKSHAPKITLVNYQAGERRIPCLKIREEKMELVF